MLVKVQLYYLNLNKKQKKQQTNKKTIVSDLKHYNQEDYTNQ